jgi:hypothetical protein
MFARAFSRKTGYAFLISFLAFQFLLAGSAAFAADSGEGYDYYNITPYVSYVSQNEIVDGKSDGKNSAFNRLSIFLEYEGSETFEDLYGGLNFGLKIGGSYTAEDENGTVYPGDTFDLGLIESGSGWFDIGPMKNGKSLRFTGAAKTGGMNDASVVEWGNEGGYYEDEIFTIPAVQPDVAQQAAPSITYRKAASGKVTGIEWQSLSSLPFSALQRIRVYKNNVLYAESKPWQNVAPGNVPSGELSFSELAEGEITRVRIQIRDLDAFSETVLPKPTVLYYTWDFYPADSSSGGGGSGDDDDDDDGSGGDGDPTDSGYGNNDGGGGDGGGCNTGYGVIAGLLALGASVAVRKKRA